MEIASEILDFWFGTAELDGGIEMREIWFRSTAEFDAEIESRFLSVHEAAARGEHDALMATPKGALALIIVLDQFPRNLFRGSARSFATDSKAREIAHSAVDNGFDKGFDAWAKVFMYLPFEHSEDLADQDRGVALMSGMPEERTVKAAREHRDVIARFGRFPHRNAVLGRINTPEEEEYLKNPPIWGKTAAEVAEMEETEAGELAAGHHPNHELK
jgi:uncharacterized protein (DUF924 family)